LSGYVVNASLSNLNASNITSGTLSISRGGIGTTTLTANQILIGNGTTAILQSPNLAWNNISNTLSATNLQMVGQITGISTLSGTTGLFGTLSTTNNTNVGLPSVGVAGGTGDKLIIYAGTNHPSGTYPYSLGINTNSLTDPNTNSITVYISPPQAGSLPNSYSLIANPRTELNNQTTITRSPIIPSSTIQPIIISGLISGTIYDVSLVTVFDTGSQTSATTISGSTLAYPPTITGVINPTENSLTVNFIAPSPGSSPISYTAVANPKSYNNSQQIITVSALSKTSTNFIFTTLTSATVYDISMIAVYDNGNQVSTDTFNGTTTSNPPTNIMVTGTTTSSISVSYDPPIGSAPISYFAIFKPETTTVGQISVTTARTTANQLTVTGLYSGTVYDISMVAVYSTGNQMSTISVSGTTLFNPPTITTLNKKITDASTNALTVYFTAPVGTLPSSYVATAVPNYTNNYQLIVNVTDINNTVSSFVIGGLVSGTTYDISMSAVYASGYSGSNVITGTTLYNSATP
jgi:predicted heme/steroid binding protein